MSLLNGLSAAGGAISSFAGEMGLQAQKSELARQQLELADSLIGARESKGRQEAGQIAEAAQGRAQTFQGSESAAQRAAAVNLEGMRLGGAAEQGRLSRENQITLEKMRLDAPPETIKLLRALGALPEQSTSTPSAASASGGNTDVSSVEPAASASTPGASAQAPTATKPGTDLSNPLVRKALGFPASGSEDAIRQALADDVGNDPKFKGATVGQKAAEVESRLAVASGKMTDPASRDAMAASIASYQLAPLTNFALTKSGGPETMAKVMELNPDYQEARYPEVVKAMAAFGSGKEGSTTRFLNVGVQHLDAFDQAAQALKNGNMRALNALGNYFNEQFGVPAPTTFDGLKQIVATEVEKSIAGGIGASADRDRLLKSLDRANSPAQLQEMTNGFRTLMAGQLKGLKTQYEDATGFKTGPFAFENKLDPVTMRALGVKPVEGAGSSSQVLPGAEPPPPVNKRPPLSSFMSR